MEKAVAVRIAALTLEDMQRPQTTLAASLDDQVRRLPEVIRDHIPGVDVDWERAVSAPVIQRWKDLATVALRQILIAGEDALEPKPVPLRAERAAYGQAGGTE